MSMRLRDHSYPGDCEIPVAGVADIGWMIGFMPAVGELVRCTDGSWMTRPPQG
jgi:hypothetical protein